MAHYAFINEENIVTEVITGVDETEPTPEGFNSWEEYYGSLRNQRCLRTSYNSNIRGKMAGIGDYYYESKDIFISDCSGCPCENYYKAVDGEI